MNDLKQRAEIFVRDITDELVDSVSNKVIKSFSKTKSKYKKGDFVAFYEGMGESSYGTIIGHSANLYKIQEWTHDEVKYPSHTRHVTSSDMRAKCTEADAMEYYLIRSGQK
jgi:hypothetical protein